MATGWITRQCGGHIQANLSMLFMKSFPLLLYLPRIRADQFFCSGLQEFVPEKAKYDLIWIQWVIGYLTDSMFAS